MRIKHKVLFSSSSILAIGIILPIAVIFSYLLNDSGDVWDHLVDTVLGTYIQNTLILMLAVGLLTALIGFSTAYLTATYTFFGSRIFDWALVLPLALPTYITAFIYAGIFGYGGTFMLFIMETFDLEYGSFYMPDIMSMEGAILVFSFVLYPYVYLICKANLVQHSSTYIEAAQTLKASPFKIFQKVILPISRPAIIGGVSLALMETISDFGTVDFYGVDTFVTGIFRTWLGLNDLSSAAHLAAMLMSFILFLIVLEKVQRGRAQYHSNSKSFKPVQKIQLRGSKAFMAFMICFLPIFFGFILPFTQVSYWATMSFSEMVDAEFVSLVVESFLIAALTAIVVSVFALLLVYSTRLDPSKTNRSILNVSKLGYSIPGAVVGIGILIASGPIDHFLIARFASLDIEIGLVLSGSFTLLVFGYAIRFLVVSINSLESGFSKVSFSLNEASQTMKASLFKTFFKIDFPLVKSSLFGAFIIVFVEVLKELPLTLILSPFNFNTLATYTYELVGQEMLVESSVPATAIILLSLVPVIMLVKNIKRA